MGTELKLVVHCENRRVADSIYKSLLPDNVNFPPGVSMNMEVKGKELMIDIKCEKNIETLISMVDELLENIQVLLGVIKVVKG
ncbi:MAG: KEOPS complex subunit Pcc1 [Nitrososphaerota archaeon]|nr:KEOPS complex subunit Pcc1 [Nitrososphaerales archaeon]MDW8045134.1 KEOPS complex subunit Pcc1 [Nitrososphaerota archaeon]